MKGSGWILPVVALAVLIGFKIVIRLDVGSESEEERFKKIMNLDPVAKVAYLAGRVEAREWYLARLDPEERSYLEPLIFFRGSYRLAEITHDAMKMRVLTLEQAERSAKVFTDTALVERAFDGTIIVHGTLTFTQDNHFSMSITMSITRYNHETASASGSWKAIGGELTLSTSPGSNFGGTYSYDCNRDMLLLRIREAVMPEVLSGDTEKGVTTLLWRKI